jgi:condensin-2 complex subunit G2
MFKIQILSTVRHREVSTMTSPTDFNKSKMAVFEPVGSYDIPEEEDNDGINEASSRLSLFAAVEGDGASSCRPLVRLLFHRGKQSAILASIQSHKFHKGHARRLFSGICGLLKKVIEEETFVPESAFELEDGKQQQTMDPADVVPDAKSTEALDYIKASTLCFSAYLEGLVERRTDTTDSDDRKRYSVIDVALEVAQLLHGILLSLHSCGTKGIQVQTNIASLCETWWIQRFVDREAMVPMLMPYLVAKTLDGTAQKSDVKRLFQMKNALAVLDFENESISYLKSLLLRTVSSPLFLKLPEGNRFIASLFYLHESMVKDVHQAIRVQIPESKKAILKAYGEVYFRAWKETEPGSVVCNAIEDVCLSDFLYAVLHVATPATHKSLMALLEPFHSAKKTPSVETLLYRMYGPILWRSLRAASPRVRVNAATVLSATFPLKPSSASPKEIERAIQKGISALEALLTDSDPHVRVAGSEATATVLGTYWAVLSSTDIRLLLNRKYNFV